MPYHVCDVRVAAFPDETTVSKALAAYSTSIEEFRSAVAQFICPVERTVLGGYQQHLARHLEQYLVAFLLAKPNVSRASRQYSSLLGEQADLAVSSGGASNLYVEIEFRPNVEKDLAKFQIGHNAGRLGIGILVLAISRWRLNPSYTTMPEFEKFNRVIPEFKPLHPLLLVGIDGEHRLATGGD